MPRSDSSRRRALAPRLRVVRHHAHPHAVLVPLDECLAMASSVIVKTQTQSDDCAEASSLSNSRWLSAEGLKGRLVRVRVRV